MGKRPKAPVAGDAKVELKIQNKRQLYGGWERAGGGGHSPSTWLFAARPDAGLDSGVGGGGVQNPTSCLKITLNRTSVEPATLSTADTTAGV